MASWATGSPQIFGSHVRYLKGLYRKKKSMYLCLDFFPSLWMRVAFPGRQSRKRPLRDLVFFSPSSTTASSISASSFPLATFSSPPQASTLFLWSTSRMLGPSVPAGPKGLWSGHFSSPPDACNLQGLLPKPPSSQTPVQDCTVHLSHPDYPASSGCHSCFISCPVCYFCKQEVATLDWFCLATDSVSQCPEHPPQDLGIDSSLIQEITVEFTMIHTGARVLHYSGKY